MVAENVPERLDVCSLEYRTDGREGFVSGHEDGIIRDIEALSVGSSQTKVDVQLSSLQCGVQGSIPCSVCEKLEWRTERKDCVDLVDRDALAQLDILVGILLGTTKPVSTLDTYSFGHSRDRLLSRQNTNVVSILHEPVVGTASEVGEWLTIVDVRDVKQCLRVCWDIGNNVRWVNTLENVVRKKSSNGDGVVTELDGLALRNVPWHIDEGLVCWRKDRDVRGCSESVRQSVYKPHKLEQSTEIGLRPKKRCDITLG